MDIALIAVTIPPTLDLKLISNILVLSCIYQSVSPLRTQEFFYFAYQRRFLLDFCRNFHPLKAGFSQTA